MLPDPALLLAIAATAAIVLVLTTRRTFRYENCSVVMYSSRLKRWSKRERLQPLGLRDGIHLYRDQKGRIWRIQRSRSSCAGSRGSLTPRRRSCWSDS